MAITQLSAFLENTPGTLYKAVSAISDAGVNLRVHLREDVLFAAGVRSRRGILYSAGSRRVRK